MKSAPWILVIASAFAVAAACGSSKDSSFRPATDSPGDADGSSGSAGASGADSKTVIPSENIYFARESHELDAEARASLEDEVAWMKENPDREVVIHGFASDLARPTDNLTLGNNRANAIREYLVQQGVEVARISVVSQGEGDPVITPGIQRRAVFASERE